MAWMDTRISVKMKEFERTDLLNAGWTELNTIWRSPSGHLYLGLDNALEAFKDSNPVTFVHEAHRGHERVSNGYTSVNRALRKHGRVREGVRGGGEPGRHPFCPQLPALPHSAGDRRPEV